MRFDPSSVWGLDSSPRGKSRPQNELAAALDVAAQQYGLITLAQAQGAGLSPGEIRHLVAKDIWRRLHSGLFVVGGSPASVGQRLLAPALAAPGALVSHRSALWLWGLAGRDMQTVELVVPREQRPRFAGATYHRCRDLHLTGVSERFRIPVTNPVRALVDGAAVMSRVDTRQALDRIIARKLASVVAVMAEVDRVGRPGRRGAGVLRELLRDLGPGADRPPSVLEARMRRIFRSLNIPQPECELVVGPAGEYRLDFALVDAMLDVEADGWEVHSSEEARQHDLARQNHLTEMGFGFLRYTWNDCVRHPRYVAAEIERVYRARIRALRHPAKRLGTRSVA